MWSTVTLVLRLLFAPLWYALLLPYYSATLALPLYLCGLLSLGLYLLALAVRPIDRRLKTRCNFTWPCQKPCPHCIQVEVDSCH